MFAVHFTSKYASHKSVAVVMYMYTVLAKHRLPVLQTCIAHRLKRMQGTQQGSILPLLERACSWQAWGGNESSIILVWITLSCHFKTLVWLGLLRNIMPKSMDGLDLRTRLNQVVLVTLLSATLVVIDAADA